VTIVDSPPLQVWPGVVLLQGPALTDAYYLVSAGIRAAARNGYPTSRFELIRQAIRDADVSPTRHGDVANSAAQSDSACEEEVVTTADAATMTGLSHVRFNVWPGPVWVGALVGLGACRATSSSLKWPAERATMTQPDSYPEAWRPPGAPPPQPESPSAAVKFAVESYVAALSDTELADLLARTRPGG
jgi:hypothetical protein